jgi:hypothetical protein
MKAGRWRACQLTSISCWAATGCAASTIRPSVPSAAAMRWFEPIKASRFVASISNPTSSARAWGDRAVLEHVRTPVAGGSTRIFLQKPYSTSALLNHVRRMTLGEQGGASSPPLPSPRP